MYKHALKLVSIIVLAASLSGCGGGLNPFKRHGDPAPLPPPPPPPAAEETLPPPPPPPEEEVMPDVPPPPPLPEPEPSSATISVLPGSLEDFQNAAGATIYFDVGAQILRADAKDTLQRQAMWLNQYPSVMVQVAGNCDERGTREFNLALGARRANAVKAYLVAQGVAASRITTVSYGKERPVDPSSTEEAWALNRNALTELLSGMAQ
jgi:peptidoglycan-associated lipoprotein